MSVPSLKELETTLSELSHSEQAIERIEAFSKGLKDTKTRLSIFNADSAFVRAPIACVETQALGYNQPDDEFTLLQGDIVTTEAAYFFGERVVGKPKYVALSSSCDLVPGRRDFAALLRIKEVRAGESDGQAKLSLLLKFTRRDTMYLPALPNDADDVLCNAVQFDGICQIRSRDLALAHRLASLSLVGWRVFASFSRTVIARSNYRETAMRSAVERQPRQQSFPSDNEPVEPIGRD